MGDIECVYVYLFIYSDVPKDIRTSAGVTILIKYKDLKYCKLGASKFGNNSYQLKVYSYYIK